MKHFIIEESFWSLFPEAKIGILVCHGIDNHITDPARFSALLETASKEALDYLKDPEFCQNRVIQTWRDAFTKFKTKKGARSSVEALLKRVSNGNGVGAINPLVDLYNSISLKYALPCGGEDINTFVGNLRLTQAQGGEDFVTYGSDQSEPPFEGEVIYKDDAGAVCRCWNWREAVRTMLTEETTHAFMCLELVDASRIEDLQAALTELKSHIETHLGGTVEMAILDQKQPKYLLD